MSLLVNALMALMGAVPLFSLMVIARRWRRNLWWQVAPLGLLAALWLGLLQVFYSLDLIGAGRLATALVGTGFFAAWLTMSIVLVVLAFTGPNLPPPGVVSQK